MKLFFHADSAKIICKIVFKPALPPCQAVTNQELSEHPRETRGVWGFKIKLHQNVQLLIGQKGNPNT